jgi:hypothetical protein
VQHSVAVDGQKVYEFSSGLNPDGGMLRVLDLDTPEGATAMNFIQSAFYQPIDALWDSGAGVAYLDYLQRPGATLVPDSTEKLSGGFSIAITEEETNAQFEFASTNQHPFGYFVSSSEEGGMTIKAERRVFWTEKNGMLFPSRIANVVSIGPDSGYTEVVMLNLIPLERDSPIAGKITSSSFRNLGSGYQVYEFRKPGEETLAERYRATADLPSKSENGFSTLFLWVNAIVIIALVALLLYKYRSKKAK